MDTPYLDKLVRGLEETNVAAALAAACELDALHAAAAPPVDWHAVARDAAVRIYAAEFAHQGTAEVDDELVAEFAADAAIALVAEMRKRAEFGGGA